MGYEIQLPRKKSDLGGLLQGRLEVTKKEWGEVTGWNPSTFKGDNLPVETVTWYDM